ncbi:hypothetical protein M5689_019609 [Euphorbia peplus]|nr:hypothetical protein M5689_019609 [Euphorbia peplus]
MSFSRSEAKSYNQYQWMVSSSSSSSYDGFERSSFNNGFEYRLLDPAIRLLDPAIRSHRAPEHNRSSPAVRARPVREEKISGEDVDDEAEKFLKLEHKSWNARDRWMSVNSN